VARSLKPRPVFPISKLTRSGLLSQSRSLCLSSVLHRRPSSTFSTPRWCRWRGCLPDDSLMSKAIIPIQQIAKSIYLLRGQRAILDVELARLYSVTTGNLNKAVNRNRARFPTDFMFQLTAEEADHLIFQFGRSKGRGGRRHLPYAFTEEGVAMLSRKFAERERRVGKHDKEISAIIEAIRQLMAPPEK